MEPNTHMNIAVAFADLMDDLVSKYQKTPPDLGTIGRLSTLMTAVVSAINDEDNEVAE